MKETLTDIAEVDEIDDKKLEEKITRYFIVNLWKLFGYLGYIVGMVGMILWYQAYQDNAALRTRIDEKVGQTEQHQVYLQIIENRLTELKVLAESRNDKETKELLENLLFELRQNKKTIGDKKGDKNNAGKDK